MSRLKYPLESLKSNAFISPYSECIALEVAHYLWICIYDLRRGIWNTFVYATWNNTYLSMYVSTFSSEVTVSKCLELRFPLTKVNGTYVKNAVNFLRDRRNLQLAVLTI